MTLGHVVIEAARREDDAPARGDPRLFAPLPDDGAGHASVLDLQTHEVRVEPVGNARVQDAGEQPRRQGLPAREVLPTEGHAADALDHALHHPGDALPRHLRHEVHPAVVGRRDRHGHRRRQVGRTQLIAVLAQRTLGVEGLRLARAPGRRAARLLRVVVGVAVVVLEAQGRQAAHHLDGLGAVLDVRAAPLDGRRIADDGVQVRVAELGTVVDAVVGQDGVRRNPEGTPDNAVDPPTYSVDSMIRTSSPASCPVSAAAKPVPDPTTSRSTVVSRTRRSWFPAASVGEVASPMVPP
nr:hypothetical protein [Nigerium massiliense]